VVVLAPASLYLEEAFDVLQFPHASRLDFMGACLGVGVVALLLSLHTVKVRGGVRELNFVELISGRIHHRRI